MAYTLTSIQHLAAPLNTCDHSIYYGPVLFPDLNYFIDKLQGDDKDYLIKTVSTYHFVKADKYPDHIERLREIFENNRDLFLSGKGLERCYLRFYRHRKKYTKKNMTFGILRELLLNPTGRLNCFIYNAQAAKYQIKVEASYNSSVSHLYRPTEGKPQEVLAATLESMNIAKEYFLLFRTRIQLAFWIYQEKKNKLL